MTLEICRICGSNENLKHVFREGSDELLDQIRLCANIQIDELDCLPKHVCNVCEQGLAFSYRLRKRGEETEKKLRQELLTAAKAEPETYSLGELCIKEDESDALVEETCDDELWMRDEGSGHFDGDEDLIYKAEDTDEEILQDMPEEPEEQYDEAERLITLPNERYTETDEIIEDAGLETVEIDLMELIYEDKNEMNIETEISKKFKKIQIECETCGKAFETKSKYSEHVKEHGNKRFHCQICDKWFNVRYRFDMHIKNHSSEKGAFPCPSCNKSYTIQCNLERHIRSAHNLEKRFQCSACGSSFGRADILKMHMVKHSNERNIECNICQKKFKTSQHLHYHKKSHLEKIERPKKPVRPRTKPKVKHEYYICEFCDKVSHHRTTHTNHLRTHTGEKPFKCDVCSKPFRTTHARTSHMLLHTDQRPYQCKLCGTAFRQTAHLKSHMLIHTGVKQHVCEFCQKAFTMKSNLMVHLRMHTGEMPYECNKCPQKFYQLSQVKRHKTSHNMSTNELQKEACDGNANEMGSDFNDSQISLCIDDIIEINQDGGDSVVISDCVVEEC